MKRTIFKSFFIGCIVVLLSFNVQSAENSELFTLKSIMGKSIVQLQVMDATVEFPWSGNTLGNTLNISKNGELQVTGPLIEAEKQVIDTYNQIKQALEKNSQGFITGGPLELTTPSIKSGISYLKGKTGVKLTLAEEFVANRSLFASEGNIEIISPTFQFIACFAEVTVGKTIIKIIPHPNLNCPIEHLQISPKKSPLFIQGSIDFKQLTFKDFIVSHSDLFFKFKEF